RAPSAKVEEHNAQQRPGTDIQTGLRRCSVRFELLLLLGAAQVCEVYVRDGLTLFGVGIGLLPSPCGVSEAEAQGVVLRDQFAEDNLKQAQVGTGVEFEED